MTKREYFTRYFADSALNEDWATGRLGAFLGGQTGEPALETVRRFLTEHPDLPLDLRRKVLQYADELERTVRIRRRWGGAGQRAVDGAHLRPLDKTRPARSELPLRRDTNTEEG